MKIFADLHHSGLYKSFQMLFEDRLGHEVYRPIGSEWYKEGYWQIAEPYGNHPATIEQYLGLGSYQPPDGTPNLHPIQRPITFDGFCNAEFDIIIASIPQHVETYHSLIEKYQPRAKLIYQIGNDWSVNWGMVDNLMASTMPFHVPSEKNVVFYHQEFPVNPGFVPLKAGGGYIRSFVNTLSTASIFKKDWQEFLGLEEKLPQFIFESYGGSCRDGFVDTPNKIAMKMYSSHWGLHLKTGGDGYGHIIHQWYACGRPVIVRGSQYRGKLAEKLFEHGVTCIDLDQTDNVVELVSEYTEPDKHQSMCHAAYDAFHSVVDFEAIANRVQMFLDRLI